ncbi:hypothetical protein D3C72_2439590 [compost metagenome]
MGSFRIRGQPETFGWPIFKNIRKYKLHAYHSLLFLGKRMASKDAVRRSSLRGVSYRCFSSYVWGMVGLLGSCYVGLLCWTLVIV